MRSALQGGRTVGEFYMILADGDTAAPLIAHQETHTQTIGPAIRTTPTTSVGLKTTALKISKSLPMVMLSEP